MKEIKFRAWSFLTHTMSPPSSFLEWISLYQQSPQYDIYSHFAPEKAVLMQFTGLKDKNGKEIYEGDIGKLLLDKIIPQYALCICEWDERMGGFLWTKRVLKNIENPSYGWAIQVQGFEIIGNIYENPELLKA